MSENNELLTPSIEDYLEAIYRLSNQGMGGVRSIDVASMLQVAKPSVNRALKNLADSNMILQEPYALIYLTEDGAHKAEEIFTRHRTIQQFLHQILKVEEPKAEDEACRIEHAMSNQTVELMRKFMLDYLAQGEVK